MRAMRTRAQLVFQRSGATMPQPVVSLRVDLGIKLLSGYNRIQDGQKTKQRSPGDIGTYPLIY